MLKLPFILLPLVLSSCATSTSQPEYSILTSDTTAKSCGYESLNAAKYGATIQYLERQGVFIRTNNNSICNNLGCMQEEEIRSFAREGISLTEQAYDKSTNCHYFKISKNTKAKVKNVVIGNHEGRFDISNESTRNFISINVLNIKDPVMARMNGKYVAINNGEDIIIKGKKTLKFSINTIGYEKKDFVIETSDKPEKIIKNITLVRDSRKISEQGDIGYGFRIEKGFRFCELFGNCKHKESTYTCMINDRPLDTRMITGYAGNKLEEARQYFLFSDANLHKVMKYCYKSTITENGNLRIQLQAYDDRTGEFVDAAESALSYGYVDNKLSRTNYSYSGRSDEGSASMLRLYFEISVYDKFGNLLDTKDHYVHLRTVNGRPFYDNTDFETFTFFNTSKYLDDWTIRFKAKFKLSKYEDKGYRIYDNSNSYMRSSAYFGTNDPVALNLKALQKYFPER